MSKGKKRKNTKKKANSVPARKTKNNRSILIGAIAGAIIMAVICMFIYARNAGGADGKLVPEDFDITCYADIDIEGYGVITLGLSETSAPETVANFVSLSESGFYDGLTFHRIIEGFMMQGGDPKGNGTGDSGTTIKGEFSSNGFDNPFSHTRGAISMARRSDDMNSATCQFFIVHEDSLFLDGDYAVFGYVTDGIEIVDKICEDAHPIDNDGTIPKKMQPVINSITIHE